MKKQTKKQAKKNIPSRYVAALLGIFLGMFGLHLIYLREGNGGVVWLIASILLSWTVIVPLCLGLVGFIHGITYLAWPEAEWERRFSS